MKRKDLSKAELACLRYYEKVEEGAIISQGLPVFDTHCLYSSGKEIAEKLEADHQPLILSCGERSVDISELINPNVMSSPSHYLGVDDQDNCHLSIPIFGSVLQLGYIYDLIREFGR